MKTAEEIRKMQEEMIREKNLKNKLETILERIEVYASTFPERRFMNFRYETNSEYLDDPEVIIELEKLGYQVKIWDEPSVDKPSHKIVSWDE